MEFWRTAFGGRPRLARCSQQRAQGHGRSRSPPRRQTRQIRRRLGAQRTLVLLNGRRAGPAGTGGSVGPFDLNVIPLSTVERVEVLKDGASSIYGSDAIAGVINIITKTDSSSSIDFSYTYPEIGAGQEISASGTFGMDFGRGYFRVSADYYHQWEFDRGD